MRIVYVLEHYYPALGGVEKLFRSLAEHISKCGFEIEVLTLRNNRHDKTDEVINGVKIKRLNLINRFFFTFFSPWAVIKASRNCDLIHTTSYNAAFPAYIAGKITGKKVIITFHEAWGELWFRLPFISYLHKVLYYLYERFILHLNFYRFIAVSEATRGRLISLGVPDSKIIKIYNGIDYDQYNLTHNPHNEHFTYTFFGRLGISKGIDILLEAAKVFYSKYPKTRLNLIVSYKPKSLLRKVLKRIKKYGIENHVNVIYEVSEDDLKKEIISSDCVVIPSYSEGFCFAAAETIALNVPIISSDQGALKEVVSGKHIKMKHFDSKSLIKALESAREGKWEISPRKRFEIKDQIASYQELYLNIQRG
ncbi:MAG: glycosyltransferase family 4 protein [Bacteroidales bacterium]|nr:glycosyltransferase family 4 protein [Bacteroidales bacterium]